MRVLTVNAGSSSLHLAVVADGTAGERLDLLSHPPDSPETERAVDGFVAGLEEPVAAVGHRLVHGGEALCRPTVADDDLLAALAKIVDLAPLHLPPALHLVDVLRTKLPDVPHVLVPDTAFHAGLPEHAATYPVPAEWRAEFGLRRYGFHGLSYAWATGRAAELLGRPLADLHLVAAHLGGGDSVCAVREGRSVDTSMGFTPLDGVPMSTRSGAVDPGMLLWLLDAPPGSAKPRRTLDEVRDGLYRRSGLLGLSGGLSGDTRELVAAMHPLVPRPASDQARLALAVYTHRVRREIAAAATSLDRLDALVFTGEIGWDQPEVREAVCAGLRQLGVPLPVRGNRTDDGPVSPDGAGVPVLIVEPREDLQLAAEVSRIC
jgi:acetate kinase